MKTISLTAFLFLLAGCGPSDDDIRALVRDELSRAAQKSVIQEGTPIGPYSPAIQTGRLLFVSGQIGLDPETQAFAGRDIRSQTAQALKNLNAILLKAGYDSSQVVQCTIYMKNIADFQEMNLTYGGYFPESGYPARTTVEVSDLPRGALIEIAAIAFK